jgi:hypothetical protein
MVTPQSKGSFLPNDRLHKNSYTLNKGIEFNHFTFHDLKRKGISDTEGDKMKASGHRSPEMINVFDVKWCCRTD